jgi:outer membrane immunogenic protein
MFRGVILAGASVIALTVAASAADLAPLPAAASFKDVPSYGVNWSGMYVGVNGGYGWDESKIGDKIGPDLGVSPEGGFGGGQIGVNWQQGNIVFGLEADLQAASIKDSKSVTQIYDESSPSVTTTYKSSLDWFGTLRGRVGYAADRTLVYATGGLAYGHISDEISGKATPSGGGGDCGAADDCVPSTPIDLYKQKHGTDATGYVLGGGVEHKFNQAWSVKAEYQYLNLGQDSHFANVTNEDYAVSTARLGLNYHVGGGYTPLK